MNRLILLLALLLPISLLAAPPVALQATNGLGFNTTISNLVGKGNTRIGGLFNNITDSDGSLVAGGKQNVINDSRTTGTANYGNVIVGGSGNSIRGGFGNAIIGAAASINDAVSVSTIIGEDSYITTNSDIALILGGERNKVDSTGGIVIGSGITNSSDYAIIIGFEGTNIVVNPTNASVTFNNMSLNGNGAGLSNAVEITAGANVTVTPSGNGRSFAIASTGGGGSAGFPIAVTTQFATNITSLFGMTVNTNIDGNNGVGISWEGVGNFSLSPDSVTGDVNFLSSGDFIFGVTGVRNFYGVGLLMDSHVKATADTSIDVANRELESTTSQPMLSWAGSALVATVPYIGTGSGESYISSTNTDGWTIMWGGGSVMISNTLTGSLQIFTNDSYFKTNYLTGRWSIETNGLRVASNAVTSAFTTEGPGWVANTNVLLGTWNVSSNGNSRYSGGGTNIGPLAASFLTTGASGIAAGAFTTIDGVGSGNVTLADFSKSFVIASRGRVNASADAEWQVVNNATTGLATMKANPKWGYFASANSMTLTITNTLVNFTGGTLTATLPSAVTVGEGRVFMLKNSNAIALTVATTSAQTIDGAVPATVALNASLRVISDGANWWTW